jgi:hypothetical protein
MKSISKGVMLPWFGRLGYLEKQGKAYRREQGEPAQNHPVKDEKQDRCRVGVGHLSPCASKAFLNRTDHGSARLYRGLRS